MEDEPDEGPVGGLKGREKVGVDEPGAFEEARGPVGIEDGPVGPEGPGEGPECRDGGFQPPRPPRAE